MQDQDAPVRRKPIDIRGPLPDGDLLNFHQVLADFGYETSLYDDGEVVATIQPYSPPREVWRAVCRVRSFARELRPRSTPRPRSREHAPRRRTGASSTTSSADPPSDEDPEPEPEAALSAPAAGRRCRACGTSIEHLRPQATTCSDRCRQAARRLRPADLSDLDPRGDRAERLAIGGDLIPLTESDAVRLLLTARAVRYCSRHRTVHGGDAGCPGCRSEVTRTFAGYSSSYMSLRTPARRLRHWRGERGVRYVAGAVIA